VPESADPLTSVLAANEPKPAPSAAIIPVSPPPAVPPAYTDTQQREAMRRLQSALNDTQELLGEDLAPPPPSWSPSQRWSPPPSQRPQRDAVAAEAAREARAHAYRQQQEYEAWAHHEMQAGIREEEERARRTNAETSRQNPPPPEHHLATDPDSFSPPPI